MKVLSNLLFMLLLIANLEWTLMTCFPTVNIGEIFMAHSMLQKLDELVIEVKKRTEEIENNFNHKFKDVQQKQQNKIELLELDAKNQLLDLRAQIKMMQIEEFGELYSKCPSNTQKIGLFCYSVGTERIGFNAAVDTCKSLGGFLAEPTPTKEAITQFMKQLEDNFKEEFYLIDDYKYMWIGAMELGSDADFKFLRSGFIISKEDPLVSDNVSYNAEAIAITRYSASISNDLIAARPTRRYYYICQYDTL